MGPQRQLLAEIYYTQWNGWESRVAAFWSRAWSITLTFPVFLFLLCECRHADGKVSFWDMNLSATTTLLYCLDTASIFDTDADKQESGSSPADEDWPPFRKVDSDFLICGLLCIKQAAMIYRVPTDVESQGCGMVTGSRGISLKVNYWMLDFLCEEQSYHCTVAVF